MKKQEKLLPDFLIGRSKVARVLKQNAEITRLLLCQVLNVHILFYCHLKRFLVEKPTK